MFGKLNSAETKALMSIAKVRTIYVYDLKGSLVNTSAREAGKEFDTSNNTQIC